MRWYRLAADQNEAPAQFNLGAECAKDGDHEHALKWYKLAARQGFSLACFALGQMYLKGLGVQPSDIGAYAWLYLAAQYGFQEAEPIRDQLAGTLGSADIVRANDKIREWRWKPKDDFLFSRSPS